jgi:phage/plasmid-associated DNA primase
VEPEPEEPIVIASPEPAEKIDGPVVRFVTEECDVGDASLVLAKDLYTGFQEWCRKTGLDDVSQRSFGMQLTAMGFQRRRRGRGKHWWDGIRLTTPITVEDALMERSPAMANGHSNGHANGHYEGYQTDLPT